MLHRREIDADVDVGNFRLTAPPLEEVAAVAHGAHVDDRLGTVGRDFRTVRPPDPEFHVSVRGVAAQWQLAARAAEQRGQVQDRVVPALGGTAVRGPARRPDGEPQGAAMAQDHLVTGGLGDDDRADALIGDGVGRRAAPFVNRSPRHW